MLRKFLAILTGRLILKISQTLKIGGGSAAPGYYALKIDPNLVAELTQNIPQTIVITGTNGKTTTARMLASFAKNQGFKVIRNSTGSNLERGIVSTLISSSHIGSGKLKYDLAIWELDEAAFNQVVPKIKPDIIIFLNAFRDQLDRYGEVDSVIKNWCRTLQKVSPKTIVLLNGDDYNLLKLKEAFKGKVQTFGLENFKIEGEKVVHQTKKTKLDYLATNIQPRGLDKITFKIDTYTFNLPLPGIYHVYNFLAAFATSQSLQISNRTITTSLKNFSPAFGRVEKLDFGYIFLIKNPAGATQVFQTLQGQIKKEDRLLLALNDNLADGTDVSWIWDVNFEQLLTINHQPQTICSGSRAEDLALRLKYAGFDPKDLILEKSLKKALQKALKGLSGTLFILPTYTALLELQKILASKGLKKHYWQEES
ncbi:DUF1727 domain-containing protein [Candidatus Daviesbacteria bacterium]|nr:DUF1727 domain-containing protein [Candidatus Daviesbacteria bacterium]